MSSISYRSISQAEKKIFNSKKLNKPPAIISASDKQTASVNCPRN